MASIICAARFCVKDIALYDAYDEAFLAYFKGRPCRFAGADQGAAGVACSIRVAMEAAQRGATPGAERPRSREATRAVRGKTVCASRRSATMVANRWIGTGGTSPFGTGGAQSHRHARRWWRWSQRDGGGPISGCFKEYRRDGRARRAPDRHGTARAASSRSRGARSRSSISRRDGRPDLQETLASSR